MLDDSATRRFGPFVVGEHREFSGQRLKVIGRTAEARSFTTSPIAFLDYRVAQSLTPGELDHRTTYVVVKLEPGADLKTVAGEIRRGSPTTTSTPATSGPGSRGTTGSRAPGWA